MNKHKLNASGSIGEFVPQCEEDGSYASTQCWGSTGECWCVDEYGIEIPGTISSPGQGMPDCASTIDACTLSPDPGVCVCGHTNVLFQSRNSAM